ncbi:hypothetical protein Godav_002505 [Gossypium davidsonii]|uniref:Uncharacterized protein n=2 Tax=Gossypium TaxID=3633 RepID=A0A7J8SXY6_GOSDV|nr:hypothetical protein [Gossypium davidsonii]MBA0666119.1 hypothetical protein [Gossypium klotzschianum]
MENDTNPINGALSTRAGCRVVVAPIPVYFPLGNKRYFYVGDLPPSPGTGVFIPNYINDGAEDGGHGNTTEPEIDEDEGVELIGIALYNYINAGVEDGGHGNTREPEIEEDEGAHLIGIELYNYINAGAEDGGHGNTMDPEVDEGEGEGEGAHVIGIERFHLIHFNS